MKTKPIIKVMILLTISLLFSNCKKSNDIKPTVPTTAGKGYIIGGGVTYSGDCLAVDTTGAGEVEVQIINLKAPIPFVLRVLRMPQQSSGTVTFTTNTGTPEMEFNTVVAGVSIQYGGGGLNVGQITKTGARSFQFSCTLYVIDNNGVPSTTPKNFTGAGSY